MTEKALNPTLIRVNPEPVESGTELSGVSQKVFMDRYSLKDEKGNPMEAYPEQMWRRVARAMSRAEKQELQKRWEERFYGAMEGFKFIPGGRILSGAGSGFYVTYYNCYVLPSPEDSRGGILDNLKEMVEIMSRGGGVGINLSSLRPRGARVEKVNGFSSGPMSWAGLYSVATHDIIQQGGSRRGALMLMLWDWHPDIEEFITVKRDLSKIVGANLSVCLSDSFMEAVKEDRDWDLVFPDIKDPEYDEKWDGVLAHWLDLGKKTVLYKTVKARYLWDLICEAAWASAEPGLHFMERSNKLNNNWYFNYLNCTNPCGEEALPDYGVCNLGSLNLSAFVNEEGEMDYESLSEHAKVATRFLDNVIFGDIYLFEGIKKTQLEGERRVGVGTMGLGDALIKMKVRYGSDESLPIIEKIYRTIRDACYEASADLASEKGPFPKFDAEKYPQGLFIKEMPQALQDKIKKQGVRNSVILMQAPTGSTSLMANVTSGIEPVYEFSLIRRDRLGEHKIYHPLYQEWREKHSGEEIPSWFVSANDLTPEEHVKVQGAVQKYVDASISKTVNAPTAHSVDDVKKLYTLAYELGLKGITYMRDGSRPGVLSRDTSAGSVQENPSKGEEAPAPVFVEAVLQRPESLQGVTYRMVTPVGSAFITINEDLSGHPLEVFVNIGKAGSDLSAMAAALGRTVSTLLRLNSPVSSRQRAQEIVDQLSGIGGARSVGFGPNKVRSLPDAVAQALRIHLQRQDFVETVLANANDEAHTNENTNDKNLHAETNGHSSGNGHANDDGHAKLASEGQELHMQAGAVMAALNPDPTPAPAEGNLPIISSAGLRGADICPVCGVAAFVHEEGCAKCYACGHAEC
ncbi:MAG: adenosylcobalamin-dependent ribonucleoside-diphosphate reductase [Patescibacteria group bacterium]